MRLLTIPKTIFEDHDTVMIDLVLSIRAPSFAEDLVVAEFIFTNNQNHYCVRIVIWSSKPLDAASCQIMSNMRQGCKLLTCERIHDQRLESFVWIVFWAPTSLVYKNLSFTLWLHKCCQRILYDLFCMCNLIFADLFYLLYLTFIVVKEIFSLFLNGFLQLLSDHCLLFQNPFR